MATTTEQTTAPPPAPEMARRIRMRPVHWIGMGLIAAFPACAALGVFGPASASRSASSASIELTVEFPTRCRYEVVEKLDVRVRNRSDRAIERVTVVLDLSYLDGFAQEQFTPSPQRAFEIDLDQLQPGETRLVAGEVQGERYGRFSGTVVARAGSESASVDVATFVFP